MTRRQTFSGSIILNLLILCAAAICVTPLHATPPAQDSDFSMEGKITEKSAGKLTLSSSDNIIFHVVYSDGTEIRKSDGSSGTAQDLKIGAKISVIGGLAESGEITAKKIALENDDANKQ